MPSNLENAIFNRCVAVTFQFEGGGELSTDREDPGNWSGGAVGAGEFRGTKFGISAAAFPNVDIENLTEDYAAGLAFAHYWVPARCGLLPECLALLLFDAAFQHGAGDGVAMLQRALGVADDGDFGPETIAAVTAQCHTAGALRQLCINFQVQRLLHMTAQPSWARLGRGLARRLVTLMAKSTDIFDKMGVFS